MTAGKNLDGFTAMTRQLIIDNGMNEVQVYTKGRRNLTIPGFYRPTKNWDILVMSKNRLLAAIELKSQVGPSFGNNFNNRVEEALGNATDANRRTENVLRFFYAFCNAVWKVQRRHWALSKFESLIRISEGPDGKLHGIWSMANPFSCSPASPSRLYP